MKKVSKKVLQEGIKSINAQIAEMSVLNAKLKERLDKVEKDTEELKKAFKSLDKELAGRESEKVYNDTHYSNIIRSGNWKKFDQCELSGFLRYCIIKEVNFINNGTRLVIMRFLFNDKKDCITLHVKYRGEFGRNSISYLELVNDFDIVK